MSQKIPYYVREIRKGQEAEDEINMLSAPRIMIASVGSSRAAKRISLGLLGIWEELEYQPVAFSAGPAYDFLHALELASRHAPYSLDSWFHDEQTLRYLITHYSESSRISLIHAEQDYFDTHTPMMPSWSDPDALETPKGSPAELARLSKTPVLLVVDAREFSFTKIAYLKGLLDFRPGEVIAGFIFAGLDQPVSKDLIRQIETELELPVLGNLPLALLEEDIPRFADTLPHAYDEFLLRKIEALKFELRNSLQISEIIRIANQAPKLDSELPKKLFQAQRKLGFDERRYRLGVAKDEAFSYYNTENLDLLQEMGADIVYFSPLHDPVLPPDLDGLYFGSGRFIEYLAEASANETMRTHILRLSSQAVPILAEGSAVVYMSQAYRTDNGREWPLVGILPSIAEKNIQINPAYYATMVARRDDLLSEHGTHIPCLIERRFNFQPEGASYRTNIRGIGNVMEGFSTHLIWASQVQLHFYAEPLSAARFSKSCKKHLEDRSKEIEGLQVGW